MKNPAFDTFSDYVYCKCNQPEYEDEKHEEREEYCYVVHGSEHDHKLSPEVGKKANQLEDPSGDSHIMCLPSSIRNHEIFPSCI